MCEEWYPKNIPEMEKVERKFEKISREFWTLVHYQWVKTMLQIFLDAYQIKNQNWLFKYFLGPTKYGKVSNVISNTNKPQLNNID